MNYWAVLGVSFVSGVLGALLLLISAWAGWESRGWWDRRKERQRREAAVPRG